MHMSSDNSPPLHVMSCHNALIIMYAMASSANAHMMEARFNHYIMMYITQGMPPPPQLCIQTTEHSL